MNNHNLMEKEKKRMQVRRQHILYLILHYLKQHGYTESCTKLFTEAQLSNGIQVCDNIDLEMILMEFDSYYHIKYDKYPVLCKKVDCATNTNETAAKESHGKSANSNSNPAKEKSKQEVVNSASANDLTDAFQITPIFPTESTDEISAIKPFKQPIEKASLYALIESLYPVDSEFRKIAESVSNEIVLQNLNVHWSDVLGLNNCKSEVQEAIVYPLKYPIFFRKKFNPWKGILFYGPPGTGKTMLAKAIATECNCTFFNITASSLVSKWRGDSEKYIRILFDLAHHHSPSIIFIDEIDWIATNTSKEALSEPARRFRAELLSRLDGLLSFSESKIILLAATNTPWNIDAALLRRLEKRIYVPMPDETSRLLILKYYTKESIPTEDLESLVDEMVHYSCADIIRLCKQAWILQNIPLWLQLESKLISLETVKYEITDYKYLATALKTTKPTAGDVKKYLEWENPVNKLYFHS